MAKISINLLPPEIMLQELKKEKFYKIQLIGIAFVLLMFFLVSLTVALRLLQNRSIEQTKATLVQEEQKVSNLKDRQVSLMLLKNRLNVISQYLGVPSAQSSMYKLLNKLIPTSVLVNSITIDKNGGVSLTAIMPNSIVLDNLVSNMITQEINEGRIKMISVETLNRGRDGIYRIDFRIKP